ncbi:MAG: hypothetical protein mread185_000120 [Mycoplasmataceae bacterium]|nr:MAG: hypothetical protein mread185_000120 [Mycoplasmataceae bacterium]
MNNLSEHLFGYDKESSEFVKEFVELLEEMNKSLVSLNSAFQHPVNYAQKIINFLENPEKNDQQLQAQQE